MECKNQTRNIRHYDQQSWENSAKSLCYDGIKAKFTQNPWLANFLLSTNDEVLAEAMFDKVWGTGVPLHCRDCTGRTQWHAIGIMGEILMAIQEELKPMPTHSDTIESTHHTTDQTPIDTEMTLNPPTKEEQQ